MNYQNGKSACSLRMGHIIEFDVNDDFLSKLKALKNEFGTIGFVGMDDINHENMWKWSTSGITIQSIQGQC